MTLRELYDNVGGSYEDALSRLMSDSLIDRFIRKYPQDKSYTQLIEAAAENDKELAFRAAHTLKGVAGNLGFSELAAYAADCLIDNSCFHFFGIYPPYVVEQSVS